jgi:putative ABC transport system permease protein
LIEGSKVCTAAEYVEDQVGVADTINAVKNLVLTVALLVIILITVLMEHSFITKERSEIAVLKALGFRNGSIVCWHTLRFGVVAVLAAVVAFALQMPMTKLLVGPIFSMMGADFGIEYEILPLQIFVIYPAMVLAATMVSAFLTAQYTRTIQTSECSNID